MSLRVEATTLEEVPEGLAAVGVPVRKGAEGPELAPGLPEAVGGVALPGELDRDWCERQGYTARAGQTLVLRPQVGGPELVLVGLGPIEGLGPDRWRRAAAGLVRAAPEGGTAALVLPAAEEVDRASVQAATEGALLAAYRFDPYKSKPKDSALDRLLMVSGPGGPSGALLDEGVERGSTTAGAVVFARDLINRPPSDLTPDELARRVVDHLGSQPGLTVEVWDESRIAEERLGALLSVSKGSTEPPRLVRATYDPPGPSDQPLHHVVLVGKGITFDSGGLSLKTADGMTQMKTDMSGAADVLAVLGALPGLGVRTKVTAIAPVTENMPGGRAMKPGDVLTTRSGATIEVLNTDAEGRLVLADALVLATELEPDAIVDIATLTGAATVALGTGIGALFGSDEGLVERVRAAGERAGEPLWPMPLPEEYADHIDSEVADMKNTGKAGQAGAIAAAMLLSRFTGSVPWAHLDIAGPARSAESSGYVTKGGTGFGVRTLLELVEAYGTT
ncbi:MAG TPA: leucyl aminopeptidase [Acidimicrobiales bacterium]|nr:leucyl aminopeptidase [Acidimicrobiales bacterium]